MLRKVQLNCTFITQFSSNSQKWFALFFVFFQVDKDFIPGLMYIRDNEATPEEFEALTLPFTVPNASGQDIQLSSKYSHITLENRAEYVRLAINYR